MLRPALLLSSGIFRPASLVSSIPVKLISRTAFFLVVSSKPGRLILKILELANRPLWIHCQAVHLVPMRGKCWLNCRLQNHPLQTRWRQIFHLGSHQTALM
jgi:hypothetical protein